jgi:hypothetical protein
MERWRLHRIVSGRWVVSGAPKRMRRVVRSGVPAKRMRVRESRAVYVCAIRMGHISVVKDTDTYTRGNFDVVRFI